MWLLFNAVAPEAAEAYRKENVKWRYFKFDIARGAAVTG